MTLFATASELLARRLVRAALLLPILLLLAPIAPRVNAQSPIFRIARISLIEGEVSYQRAGDSNKDWTEATLNMPLDERDQLYSGQTGRAEIQLSGRNLVRFDRNTNLRFTQFNTGTIQFALPVGTATFRVDSLDRRQFNVVNANDAGKDDPVYFEVDTPIVAVTFVKEGNYRLNVREDGTTEVIVRRGQAEVYNQEIGTITVKQGRRIVVDGHDVNYFQIARLEDKDNWDRWNDRRDDELFARVDSSHSARYVPVSVPGVYDLDSYGDWISTPDYGYVWSPRATPVGWAPYRVGYWRYYGGWGWTWISYEPWGWVPYHYGRWAWWGSRWCWVPSVSFGWGWSPHLVVFYGWGGGGYNSGYRDGYRDGRHGWYGWTPLGPRDRYYGHGPITVSNVRSLDNYTAPGGVSMMESRHFDQGRVIVAQNAVKDQNEIKLPPAPPRGGAQRDTDGEPRVLRNEEFKPTQGPPTRELKTERAELARRIEAPVVERRPSLNTDRLPGADRLNAPNRSAGGESVGARPIRDGQYTGTAPGGGTPGNESPERSAPVRVQNGQIIRPDSPPRAADYQTVERIPVPTRRSSDEDRSTVNRNSPSRETGDSPRSVPPPSRSETPSRDEAPRRYDPPPRRETAPSRTESPRRYDPPPVRESAPQRTESPRRNDPPPARDSAPSRTERPSPPSSPPPSRDNAPSRSESRPAPPSREKP